MSTLCASVSLGQSLDGQWAVGEGEGPGEVEGLLDVHGERATFARPGSQRPQLELTVRPVSPGVYELQEIGDDEVIVFVLQDADDAMAFERGDDDAGRALRVEAVPPALIGEWELSQPRGSGSRVSQLVIGAESLRRSRGGDSEEGPAFGLASPEGRLRLVFFPSGRDGQVLDFHAMPDGTYLAFEPGDDDFGIVHQPGEPPSWMAAATGGGELCDQAVQHIADCAAENCGGPSASPMCEDAMDQAELRSQCEAGGEDLAEMILEMSCADFFPVNDGGAGEETGPGAP